MKQDKIAADQEWKNSVWGVRPSQSTRVVPEKREVSNDITEQEWKNAVWGARPGRGTATMVQPPAADALPDRNNPGSHRWATDREWKNAVWGR